jgi:hypothetical protein
MEPRCSSEQADPGEIEATKVVRYVLHIDDTEVNEPVDELGRRYPASIEAADRAGMLAALDPADTCGASHVEVGCNDAAAIGSHQIRQRFRTDTEAQPASPGGEHSVHGQRLHDVAPLPLLSMVEFVSLGAY